MKPIQTITTENEVLQVAILSTVGGRNEQQDSYCYSLETKGGMFSVCDGMGGHDDGAEASKTAVEIFEKQYSRMTAEDEDIPLFLQETAKEADRCIAELRNAQGNRASAGSTAVTLIIRENKIYWCSVGDSRAYLFRKGELVQLTQDQIYKTVLDAQLSLGQITKECYNSELVQGEALVSYLGIGNLSLIDYNFSPISVLPGDRVILMSDGLYKLVPDSEICAMLSAVPNPSDAVQFLENKAALAAKRNHIQRDNMTVMLIAVKECSLR